MAAVLRLGDTDDASPVPVLEGHELTFVKLASGRRVCRSESRGPARSSVRADLVQRLARLHQVVHDRVPVGDLVVDVPELRPLGLGQVAAKNVRGLMRDRGEVARSVHADERVEVVTEQRASVRHRLGACDQLGIVQHPLYALRDLLAELGPAELLPDLGCLVPADVEAALDLGHHRVELGLGRRRQAVLAGVPEAELIVHDLLHHVGELVHFDLATEGAQRVVLVPGDPRRADGLGALDQALRTGGAHAGVRLVHRRVPAVADQRLGHRVEHQHGEVLLGLRHVRRCATELLLEPLALWTGGDLGVGLVAVDVPGVDLAGLHLGPERGLDVLGHVHVLAGAMHHVACSVGHARVPEVGEGTLQGRIVQGGDRAVAQSLQDLVGHLRVLRGVVLDDLAQRAVDLSAGLQPTGEEHPDRLVDTRLEEHVLAVGRRSDPGGGRLLRADERGACPLQFVRHRRRDRLTDLRRFVDDALETTELLLEIGNRAGEVTATDVLAPDVAHQGVPGPLEGGAGTRDGIGHRGRLREQALDRARHGGLCRRLLRQIRERLQGAGRGQSLSDLADGARRCAELRVLGRFVGRADRLDALSDRVDLLRAQDRLADVAEDHPLPSRAACHRSGATSYGGCVEHEGQGMVVKLRREIPVEVTVLHVSDGRPEHGRHDARREHVHVWVVVDTAGAKFGQRPQRVADRLGDAGTDQGGESAHGVLDVCPDVADEPHEAGARAVVLQRGGVDRRRSALGGLCLLLRGEELRESAHVNPRGCRGCRPSGSAASSARHRRDPIPRTRSPQKAHRCWCTRCRSRTRS